MELLRSALIVSEVINTNTFQKTFWKISLRLNEILAFKYLEKCGMPNDVFYEMVNFRYLNLETEYYQIQYIGALSSYVDLTLEFLTDITYLHILRLLIYLFLIRQGNSLT